MKKILLATMLLVGISVNAQAETNSTLLDYGAASALIVDKDEKPFYVTVSDQVTGGCLPKPNQLKENMELSLKNNGYKIIDKPNFNATEIYITALGFRNNSMCAVSLQIDMWFWILAKVPHASKVPGGNVTYVNYSYMIGNDIVNYPPSRIQNQLNKTTKKHADSIYLKISKAKDYIFAKFPSIEEEIKKGN